MATGLDETSLVCSSKIIMFAIRKGSDKGAFCMFSDSNKILAIELLDAIKFFNLQGWSPATSTNYSVRTKNSSEYIISRSGVDKSKLKGIGSTLVIFKA